MLGAIEENVNAFVEAVEQHVCNSHSPEVWRDSIRDGLSTDARSYIRERLEAGEIVDTDDLNDFAEDFYNFHRSRIERVEKRVKARGKNTSEKNFSSPAHGSLQNIAAYATLLPIAIKARQNLTGQREPLSYEEAIVWLEQEQYQGTPVFWTDITFRLRMPDPRQTDNKFDFDYLNSDTPEEAGAWLVRQLKRQVPSEYDSLHPSHVQPRISDRLHYVHFLHEPGSLELNRGKLIELAETAEYFLPLTRNITRGVWLILTDYWQRLGVQLVHEMPDRHYFTHTRAGRGGVNPQFPFMLEVREWETSPEELAAYFADLKRINNVGSKTRALTYESEVIALAALELIELHGVYAGNKGFYKNVLHNFEKRAPLYGIDPYTDFAKDATGENRVDAIRQALTRVERAHQAFHKARTRRSVENGYIPPPLFR